MENIAKFGLVDWMPYIGRKVGIPKKDIASRPRGQKELQNELPSTRQIEFKTEPWLREELTIG